MQMSIAPLNQELTIKKILVEEKTKKRLESMGVTINSKLKILSSSKGNLIIKIKDARLALDNTIARKILVF